MLTSTFRKCLPCPSRAQTRKKGQKSMNHRRSADSLSFKKEKSSPKNYGCEKIHGGLQPTHFFIFFLKGIETLGCFLGGSQYASLFLSNLKSSVISARRNLSLRPVRPFGRQAHPKEIPGPNWIVLKFPKKKKKRKDTRTSI